MTATQTLKMYQILQKHLKNDEEASVVVSQIEELVEIKIENRKSELATKQDLALLRQDMTSEMASLRQDILKFQIDMERRFNQMIIWMVSTGIGIVALLTAVLKF